MFFRTPVCWLVGLVILASFPSLAERIAGPPVLSDTLLSATRGSDVHFTRRLQSSCAGNAVSNLQLSLPNQTYSPSCGSTNLGGMVGYCTKPLVGESGKLAVQVGEGTGDKTVSSGKCGDTFVGICSVVGTLPDGTPKYGLTSPNRLLSGSGDPILCGEVTEIVGQGINPIIVD